MRSNHGLLLAFTWFSCLPSILACDSASDGPGGQGSTTGGAEPIVGLLVDDFEDGDDQAVIPGGWYGYTDTADGGLSTLSFTGGSGTSVVAQGEGFQSERSMEISYAFDQGTLAFSPFVGFGVALGSSATPFDLSGYAGIAYTYRGGAHRALIQTTEVTDFDFFSVSVPASVSWTTVTLPLQSFVQEGWGLPVTFDPSHALGIEFALRGDTGVSGKLAVDDLYLVEEAGPAAPDMTIREPAPPVDASIDSIEIESPLQAKAMQYLNRGYNITNWLEQGRFEDFTYDESFVERLAAAGFLGIRLPVDFDLYVESSSGSGDSLEITVHPDLFEVLDAFDTWTQTHGLSLTIDYHQYSTLPDKADPDAMATAVALWGQVAEHFANNPREDLFFELMNEPELSFGGTDPTPAEWGAIAQDMIDVIRSSDTTHTIIFGDTTWYGIDTLSQRTPFADDNIIYAFHTYEPFIFTHQGAAWANLGAVHDLPYPYDPERWSEYYLDLGFNLFQEAWVLAAVQNYYQEGNRSAMRNRILNAKRWAVANNVPVICNEFGAYDATSRLEDRARYYTDLISIFEELEIPWQHWFMVMDANGDVLPEYRAAMHLGE